MNGDNTHSTLFTVPGVEEQFPRLHEHQRKHAPTSQQSNKAMIFDCATACNAKVFIITSADSDPSSDPSSDRRQARCCDSNLNANNSDGNYSKSHPSKLCCCTACVYHYAPSSINNSTSIQTTYHSDLIHYRIVHRAAGKLSFRYIFISCAGVSISHH